MTIGAIVGWAVLGLVLLYVISVYNGLIRIRNLVKNAYAQIDVQLKRRYDLIPNLVETAKGYMKHEASTLEAVIQARNAAAGLAAKAGSAPGMMKDHMGAEDLLSQSMTRFMAVAEGYPTLKANQPMQALMEELASTENRVGFARQAYNDAVMEYNNQLQVFPNSLIAGPLGFQAAEPWHITNTIERENVKVAFS